MNNNPNKKNKVLQKKNISQINLKKILMNKKKDLDQRRQRSKQLKYIIPKKNYQNLLN